jgi:phosphopantothenoylcysteine decarboxylase/phosphopantothenate--cysteine ligase
VKGKHIIVALSGGIACYKTASLIRLFVKAGAEVQVVMTPHAKEFITPVTLCTLSGRDVVSEFFTANTGHWNSHVSLGLWADAMVIAPATACTIGKMAHGIADNMLVTTYLSMKAPVWVAPAMDLDMMAHPSTTANIDLLRKYGNNIIEPEAGELASHLIGKGRMAEPETIFNVIKDYFDKEKTLEGKTILITSGPTYEKIDPVRFIGNFSSGKMGAALAMECANRGAKVIMVSGPGSIKPVHPNIQRIDVVSAKEMAEAATREFPHCDAGILAAAVADYAPATYCESKIKREKVGDMTIALVKNPDIAATLGAMKSDKQKLIGFALETDHEEENALSKLRKKNLDWIVLNSLQTKGAGFQTDTNKVSVIGKDGEKHQFELKLKTEVAKDIIDTTLR